MSARLVLGASLIVVSGLVSAGCSSHSAKHDGGTAGGGSSGGGGNGGGSNGDGSAGGTGGAGGDGTSTTTQNVLMRGHDIYRRATYVQPGLTSTAVATMAPDTTFNGNATFPANGNTQQQGTASVLYLEMGPAVAGCPTTATGCTATARAANDGLFFAFPALGSNPNVVAFDETTGLPVWTAHVKSGGDGIRGTPVIDEDSRRLFVVTGNNPHLVHALSVDDGTEIMTGGWPVTLSSTTLSYNSTGFNSGDQNQHGALLIVNNILYIPFGGQYGDGGTYFGWIVAVDITDPTKLAGWSTISPRSGIWGSGGLTSDGTYVYGVTGDTTGLGRTDTGTGAVVSDSEEVVRVKGLAVFTRDEASIFVPNEWTTWDRPTGDLDFGASTPTFVPLPAGGKVPSLLLAPAKAGRIYALNGADISSGQYPGTGGELNNVIVASTTGESVYTAPTVYSSAAGMHVAINVGLAPSKCPTGTPTSAEMIMSFNITNSATPLSPVVWCAPTAGGGHMNSSPISTTTDGTANPIVWFVNGSQINAVDGDTGASLVKTTGAACAMIPSLSFPIAVKNRIVVSALGHLCSWSIDGK